MFSVPIDALSPLLGPVLTRVPQTTNYMVTVPTQGIPNTNESLGTVHFIFKVTDVDDNVTTFYWQVSCHSNQVREETMKTHFVCN